MSKFTSDAVSKLMYAFLPVPTSSFSATTGWSNQFNFVNIYGNSKFCIITSNSNAINTLWFVFIRSNKKRLFYKLSQNLRARWASKPFRNGAINPFGNIQLYVTHFSSYEKWLFDVIFFFFLWEGFVWFFYFVILAIIQILCCSSLKIALCMALEGWQRYFSADISRYNLLIKKKKIVSTYIIKVFNGLQHVFCFLFEIKQRQYIYNTDEIDFVALSSVHVRI